MSTIDNYLINGDYPDEWPEDACDLVDILREHETRYIVRVAILEAKLEAMDAAVSDCDRLEMSEFTYRPVSPEFIKAMEAGLTHGRSKGRRGWDARWEAWDPDEMLDAVTRKLQEEYAELVYMVNNGRPADRPNGILDEAADVANLVMMIADLDRLGGLDKRS